MVGQRVFTNSFDPNIYNNILADFAPQPRREPLISRKGVRLMIQFDGIRAALPEMEKTLKEVGDSL